MKKKMFTRTQYKGTGMQLKEIYHLEIDLKI